MDINEHERLSTITLKHTFKQRNTQRLYWCCAFHSHSRVFNNYQNSYPKMSQKLSLIFSWAVLFTTVGKHNIRIFVAVLFMNVKYSIILKPECSFYFFRLKNYLPCYMKAADDLNHTLLVDLWDFSLCEWRKTLKKHK